MTHEFKPYANDPGYCVAELDNGDTCNQPASEHNKRVSKKGDAEIAKTINGGKAQALAQKA